MSKEEVQRIIDDRLAVILVKELLAAKAEAHSPEMTGPGSSKDNK